MAAFSLENINYVKQRVEIALKNAAPPIKTQFKALLDSMVQDKRLTQLQFIAFTGAQSIAAGGTVLGTGVGNFYGAYIKKSGAAGTGNATDASIKFYDDATDDTTAANGLCSLRLLVANDQKCYIDPQGLPLALGLVVTGHTTIAATTDSAAADGGPGFVIIGG